VTSLRSEGLRKTFGGIRALDGVDVVFTSPAIDAIIGPNGAGKSTLLHALTGFIALDAGRVWLGDREITGLPAYRIARSGLSRTFQELRVIREMSVLDNVVAARRRQRGERLLSAMLGIRVARQEADNRRVAMDLLAFVGLESKAPELAGRLSYGQQKLLNLSCCLAAEPEILLLDEPVAGVHPEMVEKILSLLAQIRGQGRLVIFIEHDIAAVRRAADRVIVMDHGQVIVEGSPAEVLDQPEILEAYLE